MPNSPREGTSVRTVRVDDAMWTEADKIATANGTTVSAVIRDCLARYVKRSKR